MHAVAPVSKLALSFICCAVSLAALSAATHTHMHSLSHATFVLSCVAGGFALLKIVNDISVHGARPLRTIIHWIHAMVFEVMALLAVPLLKIFQTSSLTETSPGRPILLVHGYCNDESVWVYQKNRLKKKMLGPIYTISLGNPFGSIREYATKIEAKARQIKAETGRDELVLIGHSMGGLVSAMYALQLAPCGTVTDVITIGSPLQGTHVAKLGVGKNASEMRPHSELICELQKRLQEETQIRFYHIATKTDQLVIPNRSALRGDKPEREFLFEDIGHASLLFSPRVAALLAQWLT